MQIKDLTVWSRTFVAGGALGVADLPVCLLLAECPVCDMLVVLALMLNLFSDSDELAIHKALLWHLDCWGFKVSMI